MEDFDYTTLQDIFDALPKITKSDEPKSFLTGSSECVRREKLEKELFGKKKKSYYACRYEKALITISEKYNGEI